MVNVVVVTSGKGGVGKTTSTAALGAALAQAGETAVVVDFDVGLRNLDLVMGAERRAVFDLIDVIQGVAKLSQALISDKRIDKLWLLPASRRRRGGLSSASKKASILRAECWLQKQKIEIIKFFRCIAKLMAWQTSSAERFSLLHVD